MNSPNPSSTEEGDHSRVKVKLKKHLKVVNSPSPSSTEEGDYSTVKIKVKMEAKGSETGFGFGFGFLLLSFESAGRSSAPLTLTLGVPVLNSLLANSPKGNLFGEPFFFFGSFFFLGEQREERTTVVDFDFKKISQMHHLNAMMPTLFAQTILHVH